MLYRLNTDEFTSSVCWSDTTMSSSCKSHTFKPHSHEHNKCYSTILLYISCNWYDSHPTDCILPSTSGTNKQQIVIYCTQNMSAQLIPGWCNVTELHKDTQGWHNGDTKNSISILVLRNLSCCHWMPKLLYWEISKNALTGSIVFFL